MQIQINSRFFLIISFWIIPILIILSIYLQTKLINQNNVAYSLKTLLIIYTTFLFSLLINKNKNNIFINMVNLFFLITFVIPATFSNMNEYFFFRDVYQFTVDKSILLIIFQYFITVISLALIDPSPKQLNQFIPNNFQINFLIFIAIVITFISLYETLVIYKITDYFPSWIQIVKSVFNSYIAIIILFFILFLKKIYLNKFQIILISLSFFTLFLNSILNGSRSFLFSIFIIFILFSFYYEKKININIKKIFYLVLYIFLSLFIFILATSIRYSLIDPNNSFFFILLNHWLNIENTIFNIINVVISRLSYIDNAVERISNEIIYNDIINLNYYFKSIIDKLSPGFEVFNVPFSTRSVYYAHLSFSEQNNAFNSEIIPFFAELHILFNYWSIFFLILLFLFFSKVYKICDCVKEPFTSLFSILFTYFFSNILCMGMALDFYFVFFVYLFLAIFIIYLSYFIY